MAKDVLQAIKAICEEKHIPVETVLTTIEQALAAAYRKDFGNKLQNLRVEFNPQDMGIKVFDVKTVVEDQELPDEEEEESLKEAPGQKKADEEPLFKERAEERSKEPSTQAEEEEKRFNPKTDIMISEAKKIKPDAELGEEIITELEVPGEFGRMAAQTAKQVIIQRLREAERDVIFDEYKSKEGKIVNGTVQRTEGSTVLVDIGQATAVMPPSEQVRVERYTPGMQARFYIKSVATTNKGPEVLVSRTSIELVRQLFAMEVPEINDGVVEIKSISREPGSRSKIAVYTSEENVDPVGSCVGQRGTRVQFIINELGGEKIDIIEWDEDKKKFIKNALSPAKVGEVVINEEAREATALVPEDQLSLAIGKQGQNVRLASVLTGLRINIKQLTSHGEEATDDSEADVSAEAESAPKAEEATTDKKKSSKKRAEKKSVSKSTDAVAEDDAAQESKLTDGGAEGAH